MALQSALLSCPIQLCFRQAATFHQWWQAVSKAAESMGFLSLSLPLTNRDGTHRTLTWRQDVKTPNFGQEELLKVNVPVRDRRTGPHLNLKAEVCKNGSLESAGRRFALFTRLIEEHNIQSLPNENNQP